VFTICQTAAMSKAPGVVYYFLPHGRIYLAVGVGRNRVS